MNAYNALVTISIYCFLLASILQAFHGEFEYYALNIVILLMLPVFWITYKYYGNNKIVFTTLNLLYFAIVIYFGHTLSNYLAGTLPDQNNETRNILLYDGEPDLKGCELKDLEKKESNGEKEFYCNGIKVEIIEIEKVLARSINKVFGKNGQ